MDKAVYPLLELDEHAELDDLLYLLPVDGTDREPLV